eukprot:CAMPEP_0184483126 /NCGR_PEP_ID=MMETSP0113_2-20130426/4742_1 /TAXON_ID=91329 /ORGANISM="Norrisiella sphaerica, Strain BC52" /LENGTH=494 /DNA_ID=CAMNT_0026863317 /DNA_START=218 /DNA_END=1702 /DNA_ORIENTATION=+
MFLKGDIPSAIAGVPARRAEKWRKLHRKRKESMLQMRKMFIEEGTRKEREAHDRIRMTRAGRQTQDDGVQDMEITSGKTSNSLRSSNNASSMLHSSSNSFEPLPSINSNPTSPTFSHAAKGGNYSYNYDFDIDDHKPQRKGRSKRDGIKSPERKPTGASKKFSVSLTARELATALKQFHRYIDRHKGLRLIADVEEIYDEVEQKHKSLLRCVYRLQKLIIKINKEGYKLVSGGTQGAESAGEGDGSIGKGAGTATTTLSACLALIVKVLDNSDMDALRMIDESQAVKSDLELFFGTCLSQLSNTEKDILWLLMKRCHMFETGCSIADPLITCSMFMRFIYHKNPEMNLPNVAAAVSQARLRQSGMLSDHKRRPATIPQVNQKGNKAASKRRGGVGAKPTHSFKQWEDMVGGAAPGGGGGKPSVATRASKEGGRRSTSLPRIAVGRGGRGGNGNGRGGKSGLDRKTSILNKAIEGPLSFTVHRAKSPIHKEKSPK